MSALVRTALTAYAWEGASPVAMVRSLNAMLMSFSRVETFATLFVTDIDLRRHTATYCSAGHPPTMLIRGATSGEESAEEARGAAADVGEHDGIAEIELLSTQSGVVGAFEGMPYQMGSFTWNPGDILFMYTDGAIEARSPSGEFFGEQRLRDILLMRASDGVEGLCQSVLNELDVFSASALEDDIALVALRLDGVGAR